MHNAAWLLPGPGQCIRNNVGLGGGLGVGLRRGLKMGAFSEDFLAELIYSHGIKGTVVIAGNGIKIFKSHPVFGFWHIFERDEYALQIICNGVINMYTIFP